MRKWLMLIPLLCLILVPAACMNAGQQEERETGILIYYVSAAEKAEGGDAVRGAAADLALEENAPLVEQVRSVVEKLMEDPQDASLRSPLPETVELLDVAIQGRRAVVDFSAEFNHLSGVELTLANSCLVLSLSQLESLNSVSVTVQGRPAVQQPQQVFYDWNVLLSSMEDVLQTVDVTLYFANETGELVGEERILEVYEGQFVAENLVLELLKGPESRELFALLPEEFQINSVRVESGVCHVNLPAASLALLPEDEAAQRLMLRSLANSLYSLETVESLRLLADGEELEFFGLVPVAEAAQRPRE